MPPELDDTRTASAETRRRASTTPVAPAPPDLREVRLLGTPLHAVTESECVAHILSELRAGRGGWVVTHNLDHLRRLERDDAFARLCRDASLRVADGMPLVWACTLQGTPLPERVTGSNLISSLTAGAADEDRSIFLLGGDPGTAEQAATMLTTRHSGLRIAGACCPPFGFEKDRTSMTRLIEELTNAAPDIVYVALGSPKQEHLIAALHDRLPHAWWLGVGISFSFLSGHVTRAPRWMQQAGLEWVHRLVQEPGRLARRYLVDGIPFALRLLARSTLARRRSTTPSA